MQRLRKVLIANRGEIACRIARTCRRMGIAVATIHSTVDRRARHVREIGESIEIGRASPVESYLNIEAVLAAARVVGADAIHPGFGFLSENPAFVEAAEAAGFVFIGPTADTMRRVGDKAAAKHVARELGIPVVPGTLEAFDDPAALARAARAIGAPLLLKAVAGGGGRGMALVERLDELEQRIEGAAREASSAFGSSALMVERFLPHARHIEVQIAGDGRGDVIHLYERECSLQRRHQKVIEEAPAPELPGALRTQLTEDARRLAAAVSYRGVGTVEFIVAGDEYYFLEVNTRLQVEHPVTEEVTGVDLVELQLRIADTGALPLSQSDINVSGHAMETRVYAEDVHAGFLPSTGRIEMLSLPLPPVRVEAGVDEGDEITPYYDSMITKLITRGADRATALAGMQAALAATRVIGVTTNVGFLESLLAHDAVRMGIMYTRFIDDLVVNGSIVPPPSIPEAHVWAAAAVWLGRHRSTEPDAGCWRRFSDFTGWRLDAGETRPPAVASLKVFVADRTWDMCVGPVGVDGSILLAIDERVGRVALELLGADRYLVGIDGYRLEVRLRVLGDVVRASSALGANEFSVRAAAAAAAEQEAVEDHVYAPMMGRVVKVCAEEGARVSIGDTVVILESMKMELRVAAPRAGALRNLRCRPGDMIGRGDLVAEIGAAE